VAEWVLDETDPATRLAVAAAARRRVLTEHTADRRAAQLHELVGDRPAEPPDRTVIPRPAPQLGDVLSPAKI
jgi:hypothetical protein